MLWQMKQLRAATAELAQGREWMTEAKRRAGQILGSETRRGRLMLSCTEEDFARSDSADRLKILRSAAADSLRRYNAETKRMRDCYFRRLQVSRRENFGVGGRNEMKCVFEKLVPPLNLESVSVRDPKRRYPTTVRLGGNGLRMFGTCASARTCVASLLE